MIKSLCVFAWTLTLTSFALADETAQHTELVAEMANIEVNMTCEIALAIIHGEQGTTDVMKGVTIGTIIGAAMTQTNSIMRFQESAALTYSKFLLACSLDPDRMVTDVFATE